MTLGSGDFRPPSGLEEGDTAPPFVLPDAAGRTVALYADALGGGPVILALARAASDAEAKPLLDALAAAVASGVPAHAIAIVGGAAAEVAPLTAGRSFAVLADPARGVAQAYGAPQARPAPVFLIDHNRRIARIAREGDAAARVGAAVAGPRALAARRGSAALGEHPPVLVLPRVLSAADCRALIEVWHRPVKRWHSDGFQSEGFAGETGDFKVRVDSYGKTDQFIVRDPAVLDHLDARIPRRVIPQLGKAFGRRIDGREEYRIACYDASEAGALPIHRDNPTPQTRHRVFTISVHLNAGEYEGGGLRFPEYGEQVYDVEAGTAVVWSCSLLHEVLPVTRGRRFILGTHYFSGPTPGASRPA